MQTQIKFLNEKDRGGVTAPIGFTANGVLCHIKESRTKPDVALIYSEKPCAAAGVFTTNRVKAECVKLTERNISYGTAQAVIANSGNANACTGEAGYKIAERMAALAGEAVGVDAHNVVVCSTGVIGQPLPIEKIEEHIKELAGGLSKAGHENARLAIMTTDTQYKEAAVSFQLDGKTVTIGAMCKGSGMIHINMGTMLCFVTTDCAINPRMLENSLRRALKTTLNCVSVDGDMSTNDTLTILANGMAGNEKINGAGIGYETFASALEQLLRVMAKKIAADGEGATRLIECNVTGAVSDEVARGLAKEVISSSLVKAAMFGRDANWGRILCAMGYSGYDFDQNKTSVFFMSRPGAKRYGDATAGESDSAGGGTTTNAGNAIMGDEFGSDCTTCQNDCAGTTGDLRKICVFENGVPMNFDEDLAKKILSEEVVYIAVLLGDGNGRGTAWGCDLTYDYVKINGDYRT